MGADCKSAGECLRWFESNPLHHGPAREMTEVSGGGDRELPRPVQSQPSRVSQTPHHANFSGEPGQARESERDAGRHPGRPLPHQGDESSTSRDASDQGKPQHALVEPFQAARPARDQVRQPAAQPLTQTPEHARHVRDAERDRPRAVQRRVEHAHGKRHRRDRRQDGGRSEGEKNGDHQEDEGKVPARGGLLGRAADHGAGHEQRDQHAALPGLRPVALRSSHAQRRRVAAHEGDEQVPQADEPDRVHRPRERPEQAGEDQPARLVRHGSDIPSSRRRRRPPSWPDPPRRRSPRRQSAQTPAPPRARSCPPHAPCARSAPPCRSRSPG